MGGSLRVIARHDDGKGHAPTVLAQVAHEEDDLLYETATYRQFMCDVDRLCDSVMSTLMRLRADGAHVIGVGAAAKGNTLLGYCGIDRRLPARDRRRLAAEDRQVHAGLAHPDHLGRQHPTRHHARADLALEHRRSSDPKTGAPWTVVRDTNDRTIAMKFEHKPINFADGRGAIRDIFASAAPECVTLVTSNPGAVRGNHLHKQSTQHAFVVSGTMTAFSRIGGDDAPVTRIELDRRRPRHARARRSSCLRGDRVGGVPGLRGRAA